MYLSVLMFCRNFINIAASNVDRSHDAAEARLSILVQANSSNHLGVLLLSYLPAMMLKEFCFLLMDNKSRVQPPHDK